MLYGQAANLPTQHILLQVGQFLAGARLIRQGQRNLLIKEDALDARVKDYVDKLQEPSRYVKYPPRTVVLRVRQGNKGKMDPNYSDQQFIVIAGFANRTYRLADSQGRLLKRRINEDSLRVFHNRKDFLARFIHV